MNIPEIIKEHHQAMIDKGFYICPECEKDHPGQIFRYGEYMDCPNCAGSNINPNKNIGELLMLVVTELSEALEAHRNNEMECDIDDILENITSNNPILISSGMKQMNLYKGYFPFEIADVFLRLFDLCGYLEIDNLKNFGVLGELKNIAESLLLISGSLYNFHQNWLISKNINDLHVVFGSLLWLCKEMDIPIEKYILAKMAYNRTRPHKHGKEY